MSVENIFPRLNKIRFNPEAGTSSLSPIVFSPGFGGGIESVKPLLQSLANKGHQVLGAYFPMEAPTRREQTEGNPEVQKAERFLEMLKDLKTNGIEHLLLLLHSEGAIYGILAAQQTLRISDVYPRITSVVLLNPVGIVKQSVLELNARFDISGLWGLLWNRELREIGRKDQEIKRQTVWKPLSRRTLWEANAIPQTSIVEAIQELQEHGTEVHVISSQKDSVIPAKRLIKACRRLGIEPHILPGPHQALSLPLYEEKYKDEIAAIFSSNEAKIVVGARVRC